MGEIKDPHQTWRCSRYLSFFQQRDQRFVYHDLTGDVLGLSADVHHLIENFAQPRTLDDAIKSGLGETPRATVEAFLHTLIDHDILVSPNIQERARLHDRYPIRGPWVVVHDPPEGPTSCVTGRNLETPPALLQWTTDQARCWRALDGHRTLRELANQLDLPLTTLTDWIVAWTHSDVQLTRVDRVSAAFYGPHTPRPPYLKSTMPHRRIHFATATLNPAPDIIDLRSYHQRTIRDADEQFDDLETTLSHLFRISHPALGGSTYAGRLIRALRQRNMWTPYTRRVLEIGGGTGAFAATLHRALDAQHADLIPALEYRVIDISPALQASQRQRLAPWADRVSLALGDATVLDLPPASVDLVIANEMIGDLLTVRLQWTSTGVVIDEEAPWFDPNEPLEPIDHERTLTGPDEVVARMLADDVPLYDAPEIFYVNWGAICLIDQLWDALRPGGAAILTEFGDLWSYPVESTHLDHAEFSIHFGVLRHIARRKGFIAEVEEVFEMLDFEGGMDALTSTQTYFRNLRHLLATYDIRLEKVAYTRDMLDALLDNRLRAEDLTLYWRPLEQRVMGLVPREFKALCLKKPNP